MKPFVFQQFQIQQSKNVFRVGTDAVLLGSLASIENAKNVLEVGTGTGLISLMLAQRNLNSQFLGLDINEEAVALTKENFEKSPFKSRLKNKLKNFNEFESNELFDFIVSNPPYFEESDSNKDKIARQTVELNFEQLVNKSASLLTSDGILSIIIPFEAGELIEKLAAERDLFLVKKINIYGIVDSKIKRLILEFSPSQKERVEFPFIIEKSPRIYSDQYLELTKEFHVFKK